MIVVSVRGYHEHHLRRHVDSESLQVVQCRVQSRPLVVTRIYGEPPAAAEVDDDRFTATGAEYRNLDLVSPRR
ncbi:hypothetical protein AVW09_12215 [Microbacterium sp. T32]|nr:hypothetical protein [Microbacterium sp. T32]KZE41783.1 hypothetical protein AVW09_12215 [Microbacterium sp. T32]